MAGDPRSCTRGSPRSSSAAGNWPACSRPIVLGGRHDGWILLIEEDDDPHPHDLAQHRVLVEQAAPIIGTEMLRLRSVQRAKEQARGDFVHGLLHGRFATARGHRCPGGALPVPGAVLVRRRRRLGADHRRGRRLADPAAGDRAAGGPAAARAGPAHPGGDGRRRARRRPGGRAPGDDGDAGQRRRRDRRVRHGAAPLPVPPQGPGRPPRAGGLRPPRGRRPRHPRQLPRGPPGARPAGPAGLAPVCGYQELRVHAVLEEVAASRTGRSYATDLLAPLRDPSAGELEADRARLRRRRAATSTPPPATCTSTATRCSTSSTAPPGCWGWTCARRRTSSPSGWRTPWTCSPTTAAEVDRVVQPGLTRRVSRRVERLPAGRRPPRARRSSAPGRRAPAPRHSRRTASRGARGRRRRRRRPRPRRRRTASC